MEPTDFDSPWKDILEQYLPDCLAFFFPQAHAAIDWERGYSFLDKELQQIVREAEIGRQVADKLCKSGGVMASKPGCSCISRCRATRKPTSPDGC